MVTEHDQPRLGFGTTVYTEDGDRIGRIRGSDEDGFYVTLRDDLEGMSVEHIRSGHEFGEAELMWRCLECARWGNSTTTCWMPVPTAGLAARNCTTGRRTRTATVLIALSH